MADQSQELSLQEIAGVLLDLIDRLTKIEKSGTSGEAVEEQLRAYRLLKMENQSAQNFAAGFFNRAEPLMDRLSSAEQTVADKIDNSAGAAMAAIQKNKQSVDGAKNLMMQIHADAQSALEALQAKTEELEAAQEDIRLMTNDTIKRWNENTRDIKTSNVEEYAAKAAKEAFDAMSKEAIEAEVSRQVRQIMKAQKNNG